MRKTTKDQDALLRQLMNQGWRQRATKKGILLLSPDGETKVQMHSSPSDRRALRNLISMCRAGGAKL